MSAVIKKHKDLALKIIGSKVLHLNSLGKDSVLCLEWLDKFCHLTEIHSVVFRFLKHPKDDVYLKYLKKRYRGRVVFHEFYFPEDLNYICDGVYQTPVMMNYLVNSFEHYDFSMKEMVREIKEKLGCDYVCDGQSKYEMFSRRVKFHQKGILIDDRIFPLGMMSKKQVIDLIGKCGIKLHPCYKTSKSSYDHPSYWKMRNGFLECPEFYDRVKEVYPLITLDKFRYEVLLK